MTIAALLVGKLTATPERKTGQSGREFTRFRMAVADGDTTHFVFGVAFADTAQAVLACLGEGAGIAVSGALKVGIWTNDSGEARPNLSVVADAVMSLHERARIDRAVAQARGARDAAPAPTVHRRASAGAANVSRAETAALWQGKADPGGSGFDDMTDDIPY